MIITIAGNMGSGKTTVAKMLAKRLGYPHYSGGQFMREMAKQRGIGFLELTKMALIDDSIDFQIDEMIKKKGETEDNFIIEGRIAFAFIPHSFKVFLRVEPSEGARRIFQSNRSDEKENTTIQKTVQNIQIRHDSENQRYRVLYNLNPDEEGHYDLIVDTTSIPVQEVTDLIVNALKLT